MGVAGCRRVSQGVDLVSIWCSIPCLPHDGPGLVSLRVTSTTSNHHLVLLFPLEKVENKREGVCKSTAATGLLPTVVSGARKQT